MMMPFGDCSASELRAFRLMLTGVLLLLTAGCSTEPSLPPATSSSKASKDGTKTVATADVEQPALDAGPQHHDLSDAEQRGKEIYLTGVSPSGRKITAQLGGSTTKVPASVLACGNCHGHDGVGKPEGGIAPSVITWQELTKPFGPGHPSARERPAYDERTVKHAITMSVDPAGKPLDAAMPRYQLTHQDIADLIAYLKKLGDDPDPGLTDQGIVLGTILAPAESLGEMHLAVKSALEAYFAQLNSQGGIYGRRIELKTCVAPASLDERAGAVRRFVEQEPMFALVAPFIAGADSSITDLARERKLAVLGPFTLYPQVGFPLNRYVFYVYSGMAAQGQALATFAADRLGEERPRAAVLFPETDEMSRSAAEAIEDECRRQGWTEVQMRPVAGTAKAAELVAELRGANIGVVFWLVSDNREIGFLRGAAAADWRPLVLLPGSLAGPEILQAPPAFQDRLFLSFPTLPLDQNAPGIAEYEQLAKRYALPQDQLSSQIAALASAKILVEALRAAGRDASREKLIEQLELFSQHPTGLTPPISYGPNRRIGARGAYVVGIDPDHNKLVPVSKFIEPDSR